MNTDDEDEDHLSMDTLYIQGANGELVALTPEQRQLRQRLADAGCLIDAGTHENCRNYVRTQLAQATGVALQSTTGLHNPHFNVNAVVTSTPLKTSPARKSRPAPPIPSQPPPSLGTSRPLSKDVRSSSRGASSAKSEGAYFRDISKKVSQIDAKKLQKAQAGPHTDSTRTSGTTPVTRQASGATSTEGQSGAATDGPNLVDLNQTMSHSQVFSAVGRRARRNAISLFNACRCRLGLDYPQT